MAMSHLQHSLIARRIDLWQQGIRMMMPSHLRGEGHSLETRFDLPINREVTSHAPDRAEVGAQFIGQAQRLVVSEESFAGVLQTRKGRRQLPLYPRAR